jgi:hypothetical protein
VNFRVSVVHEAEKILDRLDRPAEQRVRERFVQLAVDPFDSGLSAPLADMPGTSWGRPCCAPVREAAAWNNGIAVRFRPRRYTSRAPGEPENQAGHQVMRFLIMLEQTETGFAVQAPDLAIATYGESIEAARRGWRSDSEQPRSLSRIRTAGAWSARRFNPS